MYDYMLDDNGCWCGCVDDGAALVAKNDCVHDDEMFVKISFV
jgi:hypothetical protein